METPKINKTNEYNIQDFKKVRLKLRSWFAGMAENNPEYYKVIQAMDLAEKYHSGVRKDGAPEFSHQIMICSYLQTFHKYFLNAPLVFIIAFWHDLYEDYAYDENFHVNENLINEMKKISIEGFSGSYTISKVREGKKIPYEVYFREVSECPHCSAVKIADRITNILTMYFVFSIEKQDSYYQDLDDWFFPMLKKSKRIFPQQEPYYENAKMVLSVQKYTAYAIRNSNIK